MNAKLHEVAEIEAAMVGLVLEVLDDRNDESAVGWKQRD